MKKLLIALLLCLSLTSSAKESVIKLTETNHVALRDTVTGESIAPIKEKILKLNDNESLYLFIDSPGGSVIDGIELVDILQHSNKNVTCIARKAISMAFSIFQACPTRLVIPYAILMQHRVSGQSQGNPDELNTSSKMAGDLEEILNQSDANRLELPLDEFRNKVRYEFWLIGSNKIIKNKAADATTLVTCDLELAKKKETISIDFGFFKIQLERNKCPL